MLLLKNFENLTHNDRVTAMIELGRREKNDRSVASLIDDLQKGNYCERLLALYSCYGSYNAKRVLTAITDNSLGIRRKALHIIPLACSDAQIVRALESVNLKDRFLLVKYLRQKHRLTPIDQFLNILIGRKEINIDSLLIYGTPGLVTHNLDRILERAGASEWAKLARLHPDLTISALRNYAETTTAKDRRFAHIFNNIINTPIRLRPDASLRLIQDLCTHSCFYQ